MADNQEPIPQDIPWKLAGTTFGLRAASDPSLVPPGSSVSLFTHVPILPNIDVDYPDDRLIYFKIALSISSDAESPFGVFNKSIPLIAEGLPVWTSVVDTRISPKPDPETGFNPYFIAAVPTRRLMEETGVLGHQVFEGAANSTAVGKSGTTIHDSTSSNSSTEESSGEYSSDTKVLRNISQIVDVTNRQASDERRELWSHTTEIHNILTLLTAKHVGSPYLRFVVRPQPLINISTDPSDPNLWFDQFLRRRSSGIDGMQDLMGVAVVPRNMQEFCVSVTLRNVYVYNDEPVPSDPLPEYTPYDIHRVLEYLSRRYPPGTPLDEIDVDLSDEPLRHWKDLYSPGLDVPPSSYVKDVIDRSISWAIKDWVVSTGSIPKGKDSYTGENIIDPNIMPGRGAIGAMLAAAYRHPRDKFFYTIEATAPYKTFLEAKLDMERARYEAEVSLSPLQCGIVFYVPHTLKICFNIDASGRLSVTGVNTNVGKPTILHLPDQSCIVPGSFTRFVPDWVRSRVYKWNQLDMDLIKDLITRTDWISPPEPMDPSLLDVALRNLEKISPIDPVNKSLNVIKKMFNLGDSEIESLRKAGVTDLRTLAMALNYSNAIQQRGGNIHVQTKLPITLIPKQLTSKLRKNLIQVFKRQSPKSTPKNQPKSSKSTSKKKVASKKKTTKSQNRKS